MTVREITRSAPSWPWVLTGFAALGLALWAWDAMGPDLRRYMKMSSM
jgi:hypothetical protein